MRGSLLHRLLCVWLAGAIAGGGCRTPVPVARPVPGPLPTTPAAPAAGTATTGRPQLALEDVPEGSLTVRTSDVRTVSSHAQITPLTERETAALHARLEPLPAADAAAAPPLRPATPAPPRPGPVQPIAFVAPTGKAVSDAPIAPSQVTTPLAPPQIQPQGEVRAEAHLRVQFSEAMVPVAQVDTAAPAVATITPPVAGTWRWIDTRVAQFTSAAPRLPMATTYTVTVPRGTKALSGATLAEDQRAEFSTPAIALTGGFPTTKLRPDSPALVRLSAAFDPAELVKYLRVTDGTGKRTIPHRVIRVDEAIPLWAKNPAIVLEQARDPAVTERAVVIAPVTAWPAGEDLQIVLGAGAASTEGPVRSTRESYVRFDVAPAFRVLGLTCAELYEPRPTAVCPAVSYLSVELSNPIAVHSYRAEKVQIAGTPFQDNEPSGSRVGLTTPIAEGRRFTVAIGDGLIDIYGQPMIGRRELAFTTSARRYQAYLDGPTGMHVLDPRFQIPQWTLHVEAVPSLRVELYRVEPKDFAAYEQFEAGERAAPPGTRVVDTTHRIGRDQGADVRVDLRPALGAAGVGHLVAVATATKGRERLRQLAWIQVTRLGVTSRVDGERATAWVHDISPTSRFLAPVPEATVSLHVEGKGTVLDAKTDASGQAGFDLPAAPATPPQRDRDPTTLLVVRSGADVAFAAVGRYERSVRVESARWYATDDRFTYKPGEKVYVKGWVRWTHNGPNPALALPRPGETVSYVLSDSRGTKLGGGTADLTPQGGFHAEVEIPRSANLGMAYFTFQTRSTGHRLPISIQEFRTPAYAVTLDDDVDFSGAVPLVAGETIEMTTTAKYYAGGGLPGAAIQWAGSLSTAPYEPAGWPAFTFDQPRARGSYRSWNPRYRPEKVVKATQAGSLSGASNTTVVWGIPALPDGHPGVLEVDATVTDVDRMSIRASSRPILVHPSAYYVGLRLAPNTTNVVQAIVTDIDGAPVAGVPIAIELEGVLGSEAFRSDAKVLETIPCTLTSGTEPVACPAFARSGDRFYTARARIADARGRTNRAQLDLPWWSRDDRQTLRVTPDKPLYRPGEVAKLDIRSTILPATAVVTVARQGIVSQRRLDLVQESTTFELPIEVDHIKNVHVVVDRFSRRDKTAGKSTLPLPSHDSLDVSLPVDLEAARLAMRTRPLKTLVEPGDDATFEVEVRHDGKPLAGAEVALLVVDEAVLALSGKSHADPLAPFYGELGGGTSGSSTLDSVWDSGDYLDGVPGIERFSLADSGSVGHGVAGYGSGGGGMGGFGGLGVAPIVTARKDLRATAVFSPVLATDAAGKVRVTVKMPDSLTRFRIVALATGRDKFFGKAESAIVTQRKVNARTVAPRFLTQGDAFSLPVVVQNLDAAPRTIDVAVRAANLTAVGPAGKRVTVPAGERAEVRFDFTTRARGKAVIQTILTSGSLADASTLELPVYEPATTESFATYGTVDEGTRFEQLAVPATIFPEVGGVEVELASTQLQSLTDAYWYLYRYPYECAEQRSGRMLATAALADLLDAFATPGRPSRAEMEHQSLADVAALAKEQKPDGGWGYFRGTKSDPFVTQQVLAALAAQRGRDVNTMRKAIAYVTRESNELLGRLEKAVAKPPVQRLDRAEHPYLVALAAATLSSLAAAGQDVAARAQRLDAMATTLAAYPVDAKARLLALVAKRPAAKAMRARLVRELLAATQQTASSATVTTAYVEAERLLLPSNTKTSALALDALLREVPDEAVLTKLARGVLDGRRHGRWSSTQENLVALQAMRRYFDTHEKVTPSFTGKLWFGSAGYAEQAFVGRSSTRTQARLDWTTLAPGSRHDLAIIKEGAGRLYYRVGITYAPKQADLPALDAGFIVRRSYTAVDDPKDVVKTPAGYKIRLGAKVLVTLEAVATTPRHAVALVDPVPAGFEAVNTALATAERAVVTEQSWWDHVNMRDNRTEAFRMAMPAGVHRYAYTVRATTPGTFVVAPTKAEEMYSPETFGRSPSVVVTID